MGGEESPLSENRISDVPQETFRPLETRKNSSSHLATLEKIRVDGARELVI